jgi:hypothetical protein
MRFRLLTCSKVTDTIARFAHDPLGRRIVKHSDPVSDCISAPPGNPAGRVAHSLLTRGLLPAKVAAPPREPNDAPFTAFVFSAFRANSKNMEHNKGG